MGITSQLVTAILACQMNRLPVALIPACPLIQEPPQALLGIPAPTPKPTVARQQPMRHKTLRRAPVGVSMATAFPEVPSYPLVSLSLMEKFKR